MLENILSICVHFSVMAALYQTNIFFHTNQIKLKTKNLILIGVRLDLRPLNSSKQA